MFEFENRSFEDWKTWLSKIQHSPTSIDITIQFVTAFQGTGETSRHISLGVIKHLLKLQHPSQDFLTNVCMCTGEIVYVCLCEPQTTLTCLISSPAGFSGISRISREEPAAPHSAETISPLIPVTFSNTHSAHLGEFIYAKGKHISSNTNMSHAFPRQALITKDWEEKAARKPKIQA